LECENKLRENILRSSTKKGDLGVVINKTGKASMYDGCKECKYGTKLRMIKSNISLSKNVLIRLFKELGKPKLECCI